MARGRMLDQAFTRSKKLNTCTRDSRLAYACILPFTDRAGRYCAEPVVLMANVFRHTDFTMDDIAAAVLELRDHGLIRLYADEDNSAILEFVDFLTFNKPNKNEAPTSFAAPDSAAAQALREGAYLTRERDARAMHVQSTALARVNVNVNDNVNVNVNERTPSSTALSATPTRDDITLFVDVWNQHRGPLPACQVMNGKRERAIRSLIKEHGDQALELFRDAVQAVAMNDFYVKKQYGIDVLLAGKVPTYAEQWRAGGVQLGEANIKLATQVARWSAALDAVDAERPVN
jgi:hypothetical protein